MTQGGNNTKTPENKSIYRTVWFIQQISWRKGHQSIQSLSRVRLFATPWTIPRQASLSITNLWSLLKLMSIKLVMPSNHLNLCVTPFSSCLQSFPASGYFPASQFFESRSQSIKSFSFSISPSNDYSGLISFRIDKALEKGKITSETRE